MHMSYISLIIRSTIISVANNISGRFWNYLQRCTRFCSTSLLKMWNITLPAASSQKFWVCVENEDKLVLVANPGLKISSQPFFNDSHPSQPFRCRYATILPVAWLHWNGCQGDYFNDWLWKIKIKRNRTFVRQCHFISANNGLQK